MLSDKKRLFFGYEVSAPWPLELPKGRILGVTCRHLTLAFLGDILFEPLQDSLEIMPTPQHKLGPVGYFDECLVLPDVKKPRLIAWHVSWCENLTLTYQKTLFNWLLEQGYSLDSRPFLSHVTIARSPFNPKSWIQSFEKLPLFVNGLHLYESLGNLNYQPIWSYLFLPPFEELDHTADIAFLIRAETMKDLHLHAQIALAFKFPSLLNYFGDLKDQLDDIVIALNDLITKADCAIGCPLKAVSFHGKLEKEQDLLTWIMIVDV